jgi:hypothetical protein
MDAAKRLAAPLVVVAAVALTPAGTATGQGGGDRPLRFETTDLFVEINATDGDAGLQMNLGGDEWTQLTLFDPRGRIVMDITAAGPLEGYGATDIFFESSEPPFDDVPLRRFRRRFPEGRYTFRGTTPAARTVVGSDRLTHDFPAGPAVTAPTRRQVVDPAAFAVTWEESRRRGIRLIRYEVIVTDEEADRHFVAQLGPRATSVAVPAEFLARGRDYDVEVIARERSGNQTITEVPFKTAG